MPTASVPQLGVLHCLACYIRLKKANNHGVADPADEVISILDFKKVLPGLRVK